MANSLVELPPCELEPPSAPGWGGICNDNAQSVVWSRVISFLVRFEPWGTNLRRIASMTVSGTVDEGGDVLEVVPVSEERIRRRSSRCGSRLPPGPVEASFLAGRNDRMNSSKRRMNRRSCMCVTLPDFTTDSTR